MVGILHLHRGYGQLHPQAGLCSGSNAAPCGGKALVAVADGYAHFAAAERGRYSVEHHLVLLAAGAGGQLHRVNARRAQVLSESELLTEAHSLPAALCRGGEGNITDIYIFHFAFAFL